MRSLLIVALVCVLGVPVIAHRVFGRNYPTLTSALVQSPSASPVDLPLPLWDTGLSVICLKVTNTSRVDTRITAIGLELPGRTSGFALVAPVDGGLTLQENVDGVPGFPGVTLDLAVLTGANFTGGRPRLGLAPGAPPMTVCLSGPFNRATPIETLLNGVFVRFESADAATEATDIGVWERR